jgi:uncharacterized protein YdhG (YjbR/CyaY superfamily)
LAPPPPDAAVGERETGISLQTDDNDASHSQLQQAGVDVDAEVSRLGEPVPPMFWLRDPEGNTLMVVQSQSRPSRRDPVTTADVDRYLAGLEEPKRTTLEEMRRRILEIVPDAEQGLSYGVPAFKLDGRVVAGLAAFKSHLSYLPHSGSVLAALGDKTAGYTQTKGALHFPVDAPLPQELVEQLIELKLRETGRR